MELGQECHLCVTYKVAYDGDNIILLSHFKKTTQKTPQREIKKANKLMKDYIERSRDYE